MLFTRLWEAGVIEWFERETSIPAPDGGKRKQVDFKLLCELKALCISRTAGTPRNLHFYFREDHLELLKDLRKPDTLGYPNRWMLAFVYPAPSIAEWNRAVGRLPDDLKHWKSITRVEDFPDRVYIALWGR